MLRVLHLHPATPDFQTARSLNTLIKNWDAGDPMTALSIGPGGDFGNLMDAVFRLRVSGMARTHIVHAWGPGELLAAVVAGFSRIVFSPQGKIHQNWRPWIDRLIRRRPIEVVCPTAWARDAFVFRGAPASRCHVIYPAIETSRLNGADPELRARLGLSESDIVLLAPGESLREAGHGAAVWAAAVLNVLDPQWRMLVWGRGPMVESLHHFAESNKLDRVLVNAQQRLGESVEFDRLPSAADAAIVFSRPVSPVLPVGICMAAGLPIVASENPVVREFLQNESTALIEPTANPREVAQRMLSLFKDPEARQRITLQAKNDAAMRFSLPRFIADWRNIYSSLRQ